MFLYRAINEFDLKNLELNNDIECSLVRTYNINPKDKKYKNLPIYYRLCINCNREYALDTITGHIAGKRLRKGLSCWISTTSDFRFACSEYAVPQAGGYNESGLRKSVILIDIPDSSVLKDKDIIKSYRNINNTDDIVIDLRNNNLNNLYKTSFLSEAYNENMPGYNPVKCLNYELDSSRCNVNGLSNYATYSKEVLFYKQIKRDNIKYIIYPLLQDILYGCNVDVNENYYLLQKIDIVLSNLNIYIKNNNLLEILNILYPNIKEGINITDYLYENYNNVKGNNIYEKYGYLLSLKRILLSEICNILNNKLFINLEFKNLIDDGLLVIDYNNPITITKKQLQDLLLIEKENIIYKYDPNVKKYIYRKDEIGKNKVMELMKKKY